MSASNFADRLIGSRWDTWAVTNTTRGALYTCMSEWDDFWSCTNKWEDETKSMWSDGNTNADSTASRWNII